MDNLNVFNKELNQPSKKHVLAKYVLVGVLAIMLVTILLFYTRLIPLPTTSVLTGIPVDPLTGQVFIDEATDPAILAEIETILEEVRNTPFTFSFITTEQANRLIESIPVYTTEMSLADLRYYKEHLNNSYFVPVDQTPSVAPMMYDDSTHNPWIFMKVDGEHFYRWLESRDEETIDKLYGTFDDIQEILRRYHDTQPPVKTFYEQYPDQVALGGVFHPGNPLSQHSYPSRFIAEAYTIAHLASRANPSQRETYFLQADTLVSYGVAFGWYGTSSITTTKQLITDYFSMYNQDSANASAQ